MANDKPLSPVIDTKPVIKKVVSGMKAVRTNTDQDHPDRFETINTVQGRLKSRQYDARQSALLKLKKTNNTIGEEMKPTHLVHVKYDDPSGKGIASVKVKVRANGSEHAKDRALKHLGSWPRGISDYKNAKVHRVTTLKEEENMDNTENLANMIDAVINKQPGEFKTALADELQARALEVIATRREEIAKTMFTTAGDEVEQTE